MLMKWARAYIITRSDGEVFGYSEHNRDILVKGVKCRPMDAVTASTAEQGVGGGVDTVDVEAVLDQITFKTDDIRAGVWDGAKLEGVMFDWGTRSIVREFITYQMASFEWIGKEVQITLESVGGVKVNVRTGIKGSPICAHIFGGEACGVDRTANQITVQIESLVGNLLTAAIPAPVVGQWRGGFAIHNGVQVRIAVLTDTGAYLETAFNSPLSAGDEIILQPGCGQTEAQCRSFNNFERHGGFGRLAPNESVVVEIADSENGAEYDGGSSFDRS